MRTQLRKRATLRFIAATIALGAAFGARAEPKIDDDSRAFLGVLEEFVFTPGKPDLRAQVRIGFRWDPSGWVGLPDGIDEEGDAGGPDEPGVPAKARFAAREARYAAAGQALRSVLPPRVAATVCFDGKVRGKVEGTLQERWGPRARGSYLLASDENLPWAGPRRPEFKDWIPKRRSLVVTTSGRCGDPDQWKRIAFDRAELEKLIPKLRETMRAAHRSNAEAGAEFFWPYKAYRSKQGDRLLMVSLRFGTPPLSDPPSEDESPDLYLVTAAGEVRFLGMGLSVLDAGDYDGDGQSEVLASRQEGWGGLGGLVLFSDNFKKRARFYWTWATEK